MSSLSLVTIAAPPAGLKILNNLTPCYAKLIGTGSGSNTPITVNNTSAIIILALAAGSSGLTYNATTGLVTILTSGLYEVSIMFTLTGSNSAYVDAVVNGSSISATQGRCAQTTSGGALVGTNLYNLTAGQTFGVSLSASSSVTIQNNPQDTFWHIRKVA